MHDTSIENSKRFISTYLENKKTTIVEIGSKVHANQFSIKGVLPEYVDYLGLDFQSGDNVDVLLKDPYALPLEDNSVDFVISTSCFEHSEFFWLSFLEIMRILKPEGLFYLNAPSNGAFHQCPVDCWRFYPDSAVALRNWGKRSGYNCEVLEQYTSLRVNDIWYDYVAVFIKNKDNISKYDKRIIDNFNDYYNGSKYPNLSDFSNYQFMLNVS